MNRDLIELRFEFEILERIHLETATGGAPLKNMLVKNCKIHRTTPLLESLFYRKETPTKGVFL